MVEKALTLSISPLENRREGITYRDILHEYTQNYPWLQFGIDYLLGFEADLPIDPNQQMFAPEYLMYYTEHALLEDTACTYPYVVEQEVVEPIEPQDAVKHFMLTPIQMMILFVL